MARNGSGTYNLPVGNPVVTGTTISSTWANTTLSDIATALTGSLTSDGQTTPTANLPMGNYVLTGMGNASIRTQSPSAGQVQDSAFQYLTSVSGTDTVVATAALGMSAYAAGQVFRFIASGTNTGAVTININAIGAKSITKNGTNALDASDIVTGNIVEVVYDGTQFQLNGSASLLSSDNTWTGSNTWDGSAEFNLSLRVPRLTTAQRPDGLVGYIQYNTTLDRYEASLTAVGAVINTLTHTLAVANCTTLTNHFLSTGDYIVMAGAAPGAYNGSFNVTVTGPTTFEYTMASNPGADATGGAYVYAQWAPVGGAVGGGNDQIFYLNGQTVTVDYEIPSGQNASTTGDITIDTGATVTIPSGSRWVIL